ncbi:MAG TPA: hypothetical protein VEX18_12480 [Polyangiaceae bacterium]|nr:hypothetical protein [Polyangiaceae bacterium]
MWRAAQSSREQGVGPPLTAAGSLALHDARELEGVADFRLGETCAFGDLGLRGASAELGPELANASDYELKVFFASWLLPGFDGPTRGFESADHRIDFDVGDGSRANGIADLV